MKKAIHILYSGLGGHGAVFFSIVEAPSAGNVRHEPIFFGIEPLRPEYATLCKQKNLSFVDIRKHKGVDLQSQVQVFRALQRLEADAVVIHSSTTFPAALLYRLLNPGTKLYFVEHQPNHQKTRKDWIASFIAPWICRRVIYLSSASMKEVSRRLGGFFWPSKTRVIPNGIDIGRFLPRSPSGASPRFRIGMAARMNDLKDQESLIRAVAYLKDTSRHKIELLLAGDGPLRKDLEKLAADLNLSDQIQFLGMLDEDALIDFFQKLDLYVHSTLGETMSTAIMQAQASGLPLIGSDVAGVSDQLVHGKDGILVPPKQPKELARGIANLLGNPMELFRLAKASREKAEECYCHRRMKLEYERLLQ